MYSLTGSIEMSSGIAPTIPNSDGAYRTSEVVIDEDGNMFHRTSLDIMVDKSHQIVMLSAEHVELLLKLLGLVK